MSLGRALGIPSSVLSYEPDTALVLPKCRIGLEFEFENVSARALESKKAVEKILPFYHLTKDDSLRNNGLEFVFREPMFGKDAVSAVHELCQWAQEQGYVSSKRTGIHVHLDVRDVEPSQLVGMLLMYAIYEPAIYNWIGDARDENIFCLPWYQAEGGVIEVTRVIQAATTTTSETEKNLLKEETKRVSRYAGLNLNALHKYGSIEWRHLKTTADASRIIAWINICQMFKAGVGSLPTSDGAILRSVLDMGPRKFAYSVFGPTFKHIDYPSMEQDVMDLGVPTAQELIREGLRSLVWQAVVLPKGTNKGFEKWSERVSKLTNPEPVTTMPMTNAQLVALQNAPPGQTITFFTTGTQATVGNWETF